MRGNLTTLDWPVVHKTWEIFNLQQKSKVAYKGA